MRVTIWQQFSSNHSSFFTVVGEFQSAEAAQQAANELRRILQTIVDWYAAHPEHIESWSSEGAMPPTPPERQMAGQYNVEISDRYGIDWISPETAVQSIVTVVDRHVFFTHDGQTWHGGHPFDLIMEKLGGKASIDGMFDLDWEGNLQNGQVWITELVCNAPDLSTAEAIAQEITNDVEARRAAGQAFPTDNSVRIPDPIWQPINTQWLLLDTSGGGDVVVSGRQLRFTEWGFHKIAIGFPAFIAYLRAKGCTGIDYQLGYTIEDD